MDYIGLKRRSQVVLWGASGHAQAVRNVLEQFPEKYHIAGCIDDVNKDRHGTYIGAMKVLGGVKQLDVLRDNNINDIALAFGSCAKRIEIGQLIVNKGYNLLTPIHPDAIIPRGVSIDIGSVILAGVVVDPDVQIGKFCIINNNAVVSHNCRIQDGVHICPGVHIAGNVNVGKGC